MPNPAESLEYIKCSSLSSLRLVRSLSNSIRYNCQKVCNGKRRSETILREIRKKGTFFNIISKSINYKSFKYISNHRKKTKGSSFQQDLSLLFLYTGTNDEILQQPGKQESLRHILKSSAIMYQSAD